MPCCRRVFKIILYLTSALSVGNFDVLCVCVCVCLVDERRDYSNTT